MCAQKCGAAENTGLQMAEQSKTRVSVGTFQGGIELEFDERRDIIGRYKLVCAVEIRCHIPV